MKPEDEKNFTRYGLVILTTAVFAVILSAPAGAILVNSLGKKLLTYDGEDKECTECKGDEVELEKYGTKDPKDISKVQAGTENQNVITNTDNQIVNGEIKDVIA